MINKEQVGRYTINTKFSRSIKYYDENSHVPFERNLLLIWIGDWAALLVKSINSLVYGLAVNAETELLYKIQRFNFQRQQHFLIEFIRRLPLVLWVASKALPHKKKNFQKYPLPRRKHNALWPYSFVQIPLYSNVII